MKNKKKYKTVFTFMRSQKCERMFGRSVKTDLTVRTAQDLIYVLHVSNISTVDNFQPKPVILQSRRLIFPSFPWRISHLRLLVSLGCEK